LLDVANPDVTGYLCELVSAVTASLGISKPIVRSSTLPIDPALRSQERVIATVKALGGTRYVNPSGGRELYDRATFEQSGLSLRFLAPYKESMDSILSRLLAEPASEIASEIVRETILEA
jgi:hypothetical protein